MNTAFDILVIVLGCLLGIFLILSIITTVLIMKLVRALREIIAKGEHLVDNAEAIGETLRRNAGAVSIVKLLMTLMGNARKHGKD